MNRIYIYTKDVMQLTGMQKQAAWRKLSLMREVLGKEPKQALTIKEYCKYEGISEAEVKEALK